MEYISYFFRFLWRIKWWLILVPLGLALITIYKTRYMPHYFEAESTIYVGNLTDYSGNTPATNTGTNINNIINIITAKSTLKKVSMRLYTQDMIHGDSLKDNNYITAGHFRYISKITPPSVKKLIDYSSEDSTLARLTAYANKDTHNFLYGLFHWTPPYYSYAALNQIQVSYLKGSDMIHLQYSADDPGITYHTLALLNDEFTKQYEQLRFGETNDIIRFFEEELAKVKAKLTKGENNLTTYNIKNRIINYGEQTKQLTALNFNYELQYEDILLTYQSAKTKAQDLENQIGKFAQSLRNNSLFIQQLNQISNLSSQIARIETLQPDSSVRARGSHLTNYKKELEHEEKAFRGLSDTINFNKYTKNGYPKSELIDQWLSSLLEMNEAKAKLNVMAQWKNKIDNRYTFYSPVGSTLKRKEREINFTESSYMELLHSLNSARLQQKSLQMTSANLQILTPPSFPLASAPTKRKMLVLGVLFGSFFFILGYFLLLELIDQTLRDKIRTERITKGKVIGAYPNHPKIRYQRFSKAVNENVTTILGNQLLQYTPEDKPLKINLISMEEGEGKSFITDQLKDFFIRKGLSVKCLNMTDDVSDQSKSFLKSQDIKDLYDSTDEDVIITKYPPLAKSSVPKLLLKDASVNLLIARATRSWKNPDKIQFKSLKKYSQETPVRIILTKTGWAEAEYFTGLLPPKTALRKIVYQLTQLGLTARKK